MSEEGVPLLATFYRLFEPVLLLKGLEDGRVHKLQVHRCIDASVQGAWVHRCMGAWVHG